MLAGQVVKRYLVIPAAAVIVETKIKSQNEQPICRPSELPIYTPDQKLKNVCQEKETQQPPGSLEQAIRSARLTLTKYNEDYKAFKRVAFEELEKGRGNVEGFIAYLQQEDNTLPKAGAIGVGALTGLIFGLRGGFFKKTLYATTGALGMSAICYPKEATQYSQIAVVEAKKYYTIAYNFIYGVKKDDPPLEVPSFPKLPASLTEVWDSIKSTTASFVSDEGKTKELIEQVNANKKGKSG